MGNEKFTMTIKKIEVTEKASRSWMPFLVDFAKFSVFFFVYSQLFTTFAIESGKNPVSLMH